LKHYIALFAAVFIWSSAFIVTKIALAGFGPITLSLVRILIAFLLLFPFAKKRGFHLKSLFTRNSFIYGIFGYGGNLVLLSLGLMSCSANISAIIHGLFPVFMIFFGYLLLKENITGNKILSIIFSVLGVMIASIGDLSQNKETSILGILLVAISVLTWAFYSVYAKKTAIGMDSFVLSQICFGTSFLCTLPFALIETAVNGFTIPDRGTFFSLFYLGIISGVIGTILWNYALKKVDSAAAGIYFNLMPVIGVFFAFVFGEQIKILQIIGCLLILAGVLLTSKSKLKINS